MGYGGSLEDAGQAVGRSGDGGIDGLIKEDKLSGDAEDYVGRIERKIILIDGERLAGLMIDHSVGVAVARSFVVKKLDLDYFLDDEA
jgi:restriction system protein